MTLYSEAYVAILPSYPRTGIGASEAGLEEDPAFALATGSASATSSLTRTKAHMLDSTTGPWQWLSAATTPTAATSTATTAAFDGGFTYAPPVSNEAFEFSSAAATPGPVDAVESGFDIVIVVSGEAAYQAAFTQAAARWEEIITGDIPDFTSVRHGLIDDLLIDATIAPIDGESGILGRAGPDIFRETSLLPAHGIMEFDSADVATMLASGTWTDVILHEIGHVLGIGILWDEGFLDLTNASGDYIGAHGLAEYRTLSGNPSATAVPIEHDGSGGTAESHWDEATFDTELMTGYAETSGIDMPISRMTIGLLQDMGYTVDYSAADPYTVRPPPQVDDFADSRTDVTSPFGDVAANGSNTGTLEVGGDRDWFRVQMNAGTRYAIDLRGVGSGRGTLSDPYLRVHDSSGRLAAVDDDSGASLDSRIAFAAAATGTYYVEAGAYTDSFTGTYSVSVSGAPTASSDFNGDARSDILLQNTSAQVAIWQMDGTRINGAAYVGSNLDPSWKAIGTGDFDGDGKSDILFQNTDGQVAIWQMDGTRISAGAFVGSNLDPSWKAIDTGDFSGDGKSDILFQNTDGQVAIWEMDRTNISVGAFVGSNPGSSLQVEGTGDFDGDGSSDILFQNTDGAVSIWELHGTNVAGGSGTVVGSVDPSWLVV